jgi:hypothetical protein
MNYLTRGRFVHTAPRPHAGRGRDPNGEDRHGQEPENRRSYDYWRDEAEGERPKKKSPDEDVQQVYEALSKTGTTRCTSASTAPARA